ncbi:hypothetical protein I1700191I7_10850 [Bacteroides ovatus]
MHKAGNTTTTTDYCGNVIYENGVQELLLTDAGHVTLSDKKYHYYLQDHQENNRVVVDQTGQKEEVGHYYHIMIRRDKTALIGTSGREDSVFADKQSELNVKGDKVIDMHSHPYNAQASDQDMKNLKIKTGTVYHRDSKVLFFYNSENSRIGNNEYKIDTSKTLLDKLNDKFMK